MAAPHRPATFTWSAEYRDSATARSQVIVTAAAVDSSDAVILAGMADGPLDLGGDCQIAYGGSNRPFLAAVTPEGRLTWCRMIGPVAALFRSGGRILAIAILERNEFPTIASVGRSGTLTPIGELRESHQILSVALGSKGDVFFGGCDREWLPTQFPGVPSTMVQHDGFVGRAGLDGKILWRRSIRERTGDGAKPIDFNSPFDCVTGLAPSEGDGVLVVGPYKGSLTLGPWSSSTSEGTFVARVSATGELLRAHGAAINLATSSYDARPSIAIASPQTAVTTGIFAAGALPRGRSGLGAFRDDGSVAWSLGIQADVCCKVEDFTIGGNAGRIWVAGRAEGRTLRIGSKAIEMSSSNAFVAQISSSGSLLGVQPLRGLVADLFAVLPGKRGAWLVGRNRPTESSTGMFVQWVGRRGSP